MEVVIEGKREIGIEDGFEAGRSFDACSSS